MRNRKETEQKIKYRIETFRQFLQKEKKKKRKKLGTKKKNNERLIRDIRSVFE